MIIASTFIKSLLEKKNNQHFNNFRNNAIKFICCKLIDISISEKLGPTFQQLQKLKLHQSPFVIISVIGQELLAAGLYGSSIAMLEAALQIGTCSLKLRGSVFSALSSAHWGLGNIDKAITYMQHDLSVAKSLGRFKVTRLCVISPQKCT